MTELKNRLAKELDVLIQEGADILNEETGDKESEKTNPLSIYYETWYTTALNLIEKVTPNRVKDFQDNYKLERRTTITLSTYTISDYLMGLRLPTVGIDKATATISFSTRISSQIGILMAARKSLNSILYNLQNMLQASMFDNELDAAEELLKNGHTRPAGVLAGVTLESHLETVCKNHNVKITKRNPTIDTYNTALKAKDIYEVSQWRFIQHLGDLRNKCAHKNTNEPTKEDAQDLIDGVKKIIKTVF